MMKRKMSKFTRMLLTTIVSLFAVGLACWGVTELIASDTYEPVVLRFNNEDVIKDDSNLRPTYTKKGFYDKNGKQAMSLEVTLNQQNPYVEFSNNILPDIDLSNYKYVVISTERTNCGDNAEYTLFYFKTSTTTGYPFHKFKVPSDAGWTTTVLDIANKKCTSYQGETQLSSGAMAYGDYNTSWTGNLTDLRIDYTRYTTTEGRQVNLEYIGFFNTEEEATAYAKGIDNTMPNDAAAEAISNGLDAGLSLSYADASNETDAEANAKTAVEAYVNKYCTGNGVSANKVVFKGISDYSVAGIGGSFKANVWIYLGESLQQNLIEKEITFTVQAQHAPVVLRFNNKDVVEDKSIIVDEVGCTTKAFYEEENGKKAISLNGTHTSNSYVKIKSSLSGIDLANYPYVVFSTKRTGSSVASARTVIYINGTSAYRSFRLSAAEGWTTTVLDMVNGSCASYNSAGEQLTSNLPSFMHKPGDDTWKAWTGTQTQIRLDYMKDVTDVTTYIEYIGLFSDKTEAENYAKGNNNAMPNDAVATAISEGIDAEEWTLSYAEAAVQDNAITNATTAVREYVASYCSTINNQVVFKGISDHSVVGTGGSFKAKVWIYLGESLQQNFLEKEITFSVEANPNVGKDAAVLKEVCEFSVGNYVTTKDVAYAEAKKYVDALNFTTPFEIKNGQLTKPTTQEEGKYTFDVQFEDVIEPVSCTMAIAKTEIPIIYTLDSTSAVAKFNATGNLKKSLENGYLKMTSPYPDNEDGFYLEAAYPAHGQQFDLAGRRFFKVRYSLSGIETATTDIKMQVYYWIGNTAYSRTSNVLSARHDGDTVELIMDLSVSDTVTDAIWLKNVTEDGVNGAYTTKKHIACSEESVLGTVSQFRFNLARMKGLNRTAYVEYMGFFSSLEEAQAYEGAATKRLNEAETNLQNKSLEIEWGDGNTEEKAFAKVLTMIQSDIGCTLENMVYAAPTKDKVGKVTYDAVLVSGGVTRRVSDLQVTIKKCSAPIIWRFNDLDILTELSFGTNTDATIENNVLKMVHTYPKDGDGFTFTLNTDEENEQFYLQNNPYIVVKYKRDGVGPARISYSTDKYNNTLFYPNNGNLGFGPESGTWYTSVIDTGVRDFETPLVRNYSHDEKVDDFNYYIPYSLIQEDWTYTEPYQFKGISKNFTFQMAGFKGVERTCYIEYVGFFPTLQAALDYDEAYESVKSNTEVALRDYTGEIVSFYDGNTEAAAELKAKGLIDKLLLDDVNIEIIKEWYKAPVANTSDGSYVFHAIITDTKGQHLYTTDTCTLEITSSDVREEKAYLFTNPDFIAGITGTTPTASDNFDYMQLGGTNPYFTYKFDAADTSIYLNSYPRISLGIKDATGPITLTLNETYEFTVEESNWNGELSFVFTENGYTVYSDGEEIGEGNISNADLMNMRIDDIRIDFGGNSVKVTYMVFFPSTSVQERFDYTLPEALNSIENITDATCRAGDASGSAEAVTIAKELALKDVSEGVNVVKATASNFKVSTSDEIGSYTCDVLLSYGETHATYYKRITVTSTIQKQPAKPVMLKMDETTVNSFYEENLSATVQNGCIHTETTDATKEDAFFQFMASALDSTEGIYLPDYPYISMKFKRTGSVNGNTGNTQIYFWSDANTGSPLLKCSLGAEDLLGDMWVTAIIDTNEGTITLYDMNNEKIYSTATVSGALGQYVGNLTQMRLTMARNIKTHRTADIAYFGLFPTLEAAEEFMGGLYINDYMQFTGNEYATVGADLVNAPLTLEVAVRIDSSMDKAMPLISNKGADDSYFALETTANGKVALTYCDELVATTEESIYTGKWTYITATVSENGAKIYLNGSLAAEDSANIDLDVFKKALRIAGDYVADSQSYVGDMANVKLYSVEKDADAIAECNYHMPVTAEDNMLAGWTLDKVKKDNIFEGLGDYTLTLYDQLGKQGHEFIGTDYLTTSNELLAVPKTFESWIKISSAQLSGTYTLLSNKTEESANYISIQLVDGQVVAYYNGSEVLRTTQLTIAPGTWTHIALTFDSVATLYVNGLSNAEGTATITENGVSTDKVYIGATLETDNHPFKGQMSDVRLWSDVRTEAEIQTNMKGYPHAEEDNLLAAWSLSNHNYLNYADASNNSNTATLYSATWYKLEGGVRGDYTIIHLGDTQNTTGYNGEVKFQTMFDWIAENIDELNMKYLTHAGDVTQTSTEAQWQESRKGFDKIEGKLPYGIAMGNHDYAAPSHGMGTERRDDRLFNKYFPYVDHAQNANFGAFEEGSRTNIYNIVTVGEGDKTVDYIFFSLEYGPRDDVLDWVSEILTKYSNHKAIITTHAYLEADGTLKIKDAHSGGYDFKDANEGIDIWNKILYEHDNVVMLTCGHSQGTQIQVMETKNKFGKNVVQILADPSAYGGFPSKESLIFIMSFNEDGTMHTYYYSADRDMYYGTINERTFNMSDVLYN